MVIFDTTMVIKTMMFGLNTRTGTWQEGKQTLEPIEVLKRAGNSSQLFTTKVSLPGANACVS